MLAEGLDRGEVVGPADDGPDSDNEDVREQVPLAAVEAGVAQTGEVLADREGDVAMLLLRERVAPARSVGLTPWRNQPAPTIQGEFDEVCPDSPPPLRTARAPFRRMQLKHWPTHLFQHAPRVLTVKWGTLRATLRRIFVSSARWTAPMPPAPSFLRMR